MKGTSLNPTAEKEVVPTFTGIQRLNASSPKHIGQYINSRILKKDQVACKQILNKIIEEKEQQRMQKTWQYLNREQLRMKMIETHEKNIQKEQMAGINYVYSDIPDNSNAKRSTIDAFMFSMSDNDDGKEATNLQPSQLQVHN